MTAVALLAVLVIFSIPLSSIALQLHGDTKRTAQGKELARLTEPWPEPRENLAGEWPKPLTPMQLPSRADPSGQDWIRAEESPVIAELHIGGGRHRVGEAPGTDAQRARWNTPTGQFWAIVEFNADLHEPCSHCAAPEDGERAHVGCHGCACPCGTPLPEGVDGYAIAGGTR